MRTICIIKEMINANKFKLRDIMRFNINKLKKKSICSRRKYDKKKKVYTPRKSSERHKTKSIKERENKKKKHKTKIIGEKKIEVNVKLLKKRDKIKHKII